MQYDIGMSIRLATDRSSKNFRQGEEACFCSASLFSLIERNLEISKFPVGYRQQEYCVKLGYVLYYFGTVLYCTVSLRIHVNIPFGRKPSR